MAFEELKSQIDFIQKSVDKIKFLSPPANIVKGFNISMF